MKSKQLVSKALLIVTTFVAAYFYPSLWFEFLVKINEWLTITTEFSSDWTRGIGSILSGMWASLLLLLPTFLIGPRVRFAIPTLVGLAGFSSYYIYMPIASGQIDVLTSFYFVFQSPQNTLVMLGLLLGPFLSYYLGYVLFNQFRQWSQNA
jgi:hypothetical protein